VRGERLKEDEGWELGGIGRERDLYCVMSEKGQGWRGGGRGEEVRAEGN